MTDLQIAKKAKAAKAAINRAKNQLEGGVAARDIMALERGRYLVRITDNNGIRWLMGDTTAPMRVTVTDINGGNPEEETAYRLTFSGLNAWPQMKVE